MIEFLLIAIQNFFIRFKNIRNQYNQLQFNTFSHDHYFHSAMMLHARVLGPNYLNLRASGNQAFAVKEALSYFRNRLIAVFLN